MMTIRYMVCALVVGCMFSCQTDEEEWGNLQQRNTLQVMGRVTEFQDHYVSSRALKSNEEALIKNMSIFIFKSDGTQAHYEWIEGSRPVFVIDRDDLNGENNTDAADFSNATIYILANVPEYADGDLPANIEALKAKSCVVTGIDLVEEGFPMIGNLSVNLEPTSNLEDNVLEIPLENLYSKIVFNIKVNTDQTLEGFVPSFRLQEWEVHQVPQGVAFGESEQTAYYNQIIQEDGNNKVFRSSEVEGHNPVSGSDVLSFSFYMPEHKVNPAVSAADYDYPEDISPNEKQRHKPCLVEKEFHGNDGYAGKPTYVLLKGAFTDHQGYIKNVSYKIYLGEDNYSNFQINRNCQYNNNVTIRGITNHEGGTEETISVDHRVTVEKDEFTLYVERETHLDSHFEVRPIDIEFEKEGINYAGSRVELVLLTSTGAEPNAYNLSDLPGWVRFENMNAITSGSASHCSNGKRLYFTEDLVTNTLKDNYTTTIHYGDASKRVWTYFDENTASTKGHRTATIRAKFYEKDASAPAKVMDFKFQQRNLHPVSYGGRGYLIEYYEEYLYNFDPKENYGNTTDGMEWGLNGVQLSHQYDAVYLENSPGFNVVNVLEYFGIKMTDYLNSIMDGNMPKYDFYLSRDKTELNLPSELVIRDFSGYHFTNELMEIAINSDKVSEGTLMSVPLSAVEYCYNKNKRDANGKVATIKWYLPAIDEIENITMGGYTEFEVFQNKYYWSSQPAYKYNSIVSDFYTKILGISIKYATLYGKSFTDDVLRARATKVEYQGNNVYNNVKSGVSGSLGTQTFSYRTTVKNEGFIENSPAPTPEPGNMPRTGQINRIRCVYKR